MKRYYIDPSERHNQNSGCHTSFQAYDVIDREAHPKPRALATGIRKYDAQIMCDSLNNRLATVKVKANARA